MVSVYWKIENLKEMSLLWIVEYYKRTEPEKYISLAWHVTS